MTESSGEPRPSRHFLALLPDPAARARLAAIPVPPGGRRVHPEDLHLTLAFLGDLDVAEPDELLDRVMPGWAPGPVDVLLDGLECWRGPRAYCAVGEGGAAAALTDVLRHRLEGIGHRHEPRPFRAHVTLERGLPAGACDAPRRELVPPLHWTSPALCLLASSGRQAGPGLPRYVLLGSRPLG